MNIEPITALDEIAGLLVDCQLSDEDFSEESPPLFFGMRAEGWLVAVVGLDVYGDVGLLHSLVVDPEWRGKGIAHALLAFAETQAFNRGVESLFLLTERAVQFFLPQGYEITSRVRAPLALRTRAQFSGGVPSHSALMSKKLEIMA